jgi:hypothetical protein
LLEGHFWSPTGFGTQLVEAAYLDGHIGLLQARWIRTNLDLTLMAQCQQTVKQGANAAP